MRSETATCARTLEECDVITVLGDGIMQKRNSRYSERRQRCSKY